MAIDLIEKHNKNNNLHQTIITFFNNQPYSFSTNPTQNRLVGGAKQNWKTILEQIISQKHFEQETTQIVVEEMGEHDHVKQNHDVEKLTNPYIIDPAKYNTFEELTNAIKHHWIYKRRNKPETIQKYIRIMKRMANHPVFPVNWFDLNPNQIIAYLEHREYTENAGKCAIGNEWKAVKVVARAYGMNADTWGYVPPSPPPAKVRIIPMPDTVYKLTTHKYSKNRYDNSLIQYILFHGFLLGFRPSEIVTLKVSNIFLDEGYMLIQEPKKHNQLRQVFPEEEIITFDRRKSLKNWIEHWRPKVENQYSKDYLFIQRNGKPFTVNYLRKVLNNAVKPLWNPYSLYVMRHWCAIARLIHSKEETGRWDIWDVKETLGHDDIKTTETYIRFAKRYYKIAHYDWIKALLKFYKKDYIEQHRGLIEGYLNEPCFRVETTGVDGYGSAGIRTRVRGSGGLCDIQATLQTQIVKEKNNKKIG